MNYPESVQILEQIKSATRILVNCHRSPDPDSVASAMSVYTLLKDLGKNDITVISPDEIPENCKFLPNSNIIKVVDFNTFDFNSYDLFIIVDAGNWKQISGEENIKSSKIRKIVIDHHYTNPGYGDLNLIDEKGGSCCSVIFNLITDLGFAISKELATTLLTGMIADTMSFQTDVIGESALENADKLIKLGADRKDIIFNLYMSRSIDEIHLMGEMLTRTKIDTEGKFAWVAIPKDLVKIFPKSRDAKSYVAGVFMQSVGGTDFGFVLEEYENYCSVSFRSRTKFDVSQIAQDLGGGGHKSAAAARLIDTTFENAVEKVLNAARRYARKD